MTLASQLGQLRLKTRFIYIIYYEPQMSHRPQTSSRCLVASVSVTISFIIDVSISISRGTLALALTLAVALVLKLALALTSVLTSSLVLALMLALATAAIVHFPYALVWMVKPAETESVALFSDLQLILTVAHTVVMFSSPKRVKKKWNCGDSRATSVSEVMHENQYQSSVC